MKCLKADDLYALPLWDKLGEAAKVHSMHVNPT